MSATTLYTPKNILYIAKDFFENGFNAAQRLPKENQTPEMFNQISFPATCLSFSLELSLKSFHLNTGTKKKGHDLEMLFYELPKNMQNKIYDHLKTHDKCQSLISIILKKGNESDFKEGIKKEPFKNKEDEVKRILASHKSAFIDFRYLFEIAEKTEQGDEWNFSFRSLGNLSYSTIMIASKELGITLPEL